MDTSRETPAPELPEFGELHEHHYAVLDRIARERMPVSVIAEFYLMSLVKCMKAKATGNLEAWIQGERQLASLTGLAIGMGVGRELAPTVEAEAPRFYERSFQPSEWLTD